VSALQSQQFWHLPQTAHTNWASLPHFGKVEKLISSMDNILGVRLISFSKSTDDFHPDILKEGRLKDGSENN
jgi:hypothetical protein